MYYKIERRIFERIEGELAVRYSVAGGIRQRYATTRNISGGGMKVALSERLDPGTVLQLEIFRGNARISARGKGEIAWISRASTQEKGSKFFEAGIRFIEISLLYIGALIDDLEARRTSAHLSNTGRY